MHAFFRIVLPVTLGALIFSSTSEAGVRASSSLQNTDGRHLASNLVDGSLVSGWAEAQEGYGEGSWVEVDLGRTTSLTSISIWPGNLTTGKRSFREYARPRLLSISVDGEAFGEPIRLADEIQRLDIPYEGKGRKIRIVIDEVYEGLVFSDCFIAEVGVNFFEDAAADPPASLQKWAESSSGKRARERFLAELAVKETAHRDSELSDREALAWIMDAAAEGAPYYAKRARSVVSRVGARAAAIPPDPDAIAALRRLKDPNAIPALEAAALRLVGEARVGLEQIVEYFYAYQELIGGPDPNVPYWGASGWANGALRGFDEPLALVVDRDRAVLVADTGNNRIQAYSEEGRPIRSWGAKTGITTDWFDDTRVWYVGASVATEEPGGWINPLDVVLIPEKEADGFAALDAKGRIQVYDPDGNIKIGWQLHSDNVVEPGVGGEGYLAYLEKKGVLVAVYGDEAIGFTLTGDEVSRFDIGDGAPNAVVADKKGRLTMAFGSKLVRYNLDGFRYGEFMDLRDYDKGFEDIDVTFDEAHKMWVVTDNGLCIKFKRPGKVDFQVQLTEYSLESPRVAVFDGMVYVTDRDAVVVVDALQKQIDEAEAAAAAEAE